MAAAPRTLCGKNLKDGTGLGDGVQEVILHWKSERGVGIKLCEVENEAFQEEEAACGGEEYGIFEKSEQQTNGWT